MVRAMTTPKQRARWHRRATWLSQLGLDLDDPVPVQPVEDVAEAVLALLEEVQRLEGQLREARRIGAWLYEHLSPGARRSLGDVSEWPWLLDAARQE